MTSTPNIDQVATIRGVLKYFKATSYITGIFLILIMVLWGIRLTIQADLWLGGPDAFLQLAYYSVDSSGEKIGFPTSGIDITVISLIVHGWLYVAYLFGCFRIWSAMRWSTMWFPVLAAGGVIPFLSFFTERRVRTIVNNTLESNA